MIQRVLDDLDTPLFLVVAGGYLPLVFDAGGKEREEETFVESLETPSPQEVILRFFAFHCVNELQSKEKLSLQMNYKIETWIALLVQRIIYA